MGKGNPGKNAAWRLLFVLYCLAMGYLLFVQGRAPVTDVPYWQQVQENYNFQPLRTISAYWDILSRRDYYLEKYGSEWYAYQGLHALRNLAGNMLLFLPLGAFLPGLDPAQRRLWRCALTALGILLAVEILQLFSLRGACDVDDVLLNLAGVLLGYGLWRLGQIRKRK